MLPHPHPRLGPRVRPRRARPTIFVTVPRARCAAGRPVSPAPSHMPSADHAAHCAAKAPQEAGRQLCWPRSHSAVNVPASAARASTALAITRSHGAARKRASTAAWGPANHAARDSAKPTEKAIRRCWWTHACGKRPAPYAPDDRPDSSARARCAAREPRNPAACRKRTTLLAAPRCRRRRQPGGATGPASAAWTSHRPAPRASDDVPDCKTPCLYGW